MAGSDFVSIILAIIIPPLGVLWKQRRVSGALLINILLTILGYIPGIIHALYVVLHS